ncbi:hypothetical protein I4U23_024802 [Adineta vaga]|nr:hypothetical protein I4U23_024802 [Adineta vaga]
MEASDNHLFTPWTPDIIDDDDEYAEIIKEAERAIEGEILPIRIAAGSSGSYFVRNLEGKTIGVFKPKDEEPYGRFNPKWTKWLQKTLCPCCFGRGCLIPNQGYLSEAGASLIDRKLRLNIVPKTRVVRLAAESFNYPAYQRHLVTAKREINHSVGRHMHGKRVFAPKGLHPKIGSLQLFVNNYIDADVFLKQIEQNPLSKEVMERFQKQFEKLVVLDYIIRNTDRNMSNWLVKYDLKVNNERDKVLQAIANPHFNLINRLILIMIIMQLYKKKIQMIFILQLLIMDLPFHLNILMNGVLIHFIGVGYHSLKSHFLKKSNLIYFHSYLI